MPLLPLTLAALLATQPVSAVELKNLSVYYQRFHPSNRIADLQGHSAKEGVGLQLDTDLWGPLYWNNRIIAYTDNGQYRLVGWNMHFGVRFSKNFSVEYEHFSKHLLDTVGENKFPVQDSLGFIWQIYP